MIKRRFFVFLLIIFIGLGIYFISRGYYPVALVNYKFISFKDFSMDSAVALYYYEKNSEIYKKAATADNNFKKDIQRAALDQLIESRLIHQELLKFLSENNINEMVNKKIEEFINRPSIRKGTESLYGLQVQDFKNLILRPIAEQEILEARLFLSTNQSFKSWLNDVKLRANVMILIPGFDWEDNKVIIN